MDILMISTFPPRRCGIGDYTADLVRELAENKDVRIRVLTYQDGIGAGTSYQNGFEISRQLKNRTSPRSMDSLLKQSGADLVHLQSSSFLHRPSLSAAIAQTCAVPLVTTVHDTPGSWRLFYTIPALREVYRKSARLITHSQGVSRILLEFHDIEDDRLVRIPYGVDTMRYHPAADGGEIRNIYGLGDKRIVLFFGFLRPGKGLESLLMAWSKIEHRYPEALLVIAGGIPDRPRRFALFLRSEKDYPRRLQELVRRLDIEERILFTDYVPKARVPGLLAMADMVVLPYEGNPSQSDSLYKALSCGTPIIATGVQGFREMLEEGKDTILFPPKDFNALADSMDILLGDSARALEMGKCARRKVEEHHDLSVVAKKMLKIYSDTLEEG